MRQTLREHGLDAGADTIPWYLRHHRYITGSRATIHRALRRDNMVTPVPKKRPKRSHIRFHAEQPNEKWQSEFTRWALADRTDIEILTWLDDHSRYALSATAPQPVTGLVVVDTFIAATERHRVRCPH